MSTDRHIRRISDITERGAYAEHYLMYEVMPSRHCCLLSGSLIDTPAGLQPIDCLRPGDHVWGFVRDAKVAALIIKVHRGERAQDGESGYRLKDTVIVSGHTCLCWQRHWTEAAELPLETADFTGPVYDLETDTGNFYCQGVLIGHYGPEVMEPISEHYEAIYES